MLEIKINERSIETVTAGEDYIRGTVGAKVSITFDDFWADYEKTIVFKRCYGSVLNEPVRVLVNDMNTVIDIPPEIIAESGKYTIGMVGIKDGVVLPTFYSEEFNTPYGTDTHGTAPHPYTPNEIDQLRLSKQDKLTAGSGIKIENNVISASGGGIGGTTDYELLENKPQINGIELKGNKSLTDLGIDIPTKTSDLENDSGFIDDTAFENYYTKTEVDDKISAIPSGGGGETWEVISDTTTEFNTPVSQIVINQDTNGNSFSLKKMRVFIDFTVSEAYTGIARGITAESNLMYIVSQSFSAGSVYGYFIDSEVLPMVNNRCQNISHFNDTRMLENGNNFDFNYNIGAVDYGIRTEKMTVTTLGYNVSSISNFDFRLGSGGKINKARILIFGVRA